MSAMKRAIYLFALLPALLGAQPAAQPTWTSPEVHSDGRVTFRILAPKAAAVALRGEWPGGAKELPLNKDGEGLWSVTTAPIPADFYWYHFVVDGVKTMDPRNPLLKTGARSSDSAVDIPGSNAAHHALRNVPHGTVHIELYKSAATGTLRRLHVYTPPGYEEGRARYPVLYLLHGSGDTDREWTSYGRAHLIADNLIADGKLKPLVIVMTDGHPADPNNPSLRARNTELFTRDLIDSVIPFAEKKYRIDARRERRALAGLSMGGGQTLAAGLKNLGRFSALGVFSMGIRDDSFETQQQELLANPGNANSRLRLFWIACGKDDFLWEAAVRLHETLEKRGVQHTWRPSEGAHTWPVWRRYLHEFLPLLFQ
jgi:enterochelin esterase-like enzyme